MRRTPETVLLTQQRMRLTTSADCRCSQSADQSVPELDCKPYGGEGKEYDPEGKEGRLDAAELRGCEYLAAGMHWEQSIDREENDVIDRCERASSWER